MYHVQSYKKEQTDNVQNKISEIKNAIYNNKISLKAN